jgi:hypothetical protein
MTRLGYKQKIKEMDRGTVRMLSEAMKEALKEVADEYGLALDYKGASYSSSNATFKFELATKGSKGANTREKEAFVKTAILFGLDAKDLGKEFTHEGWTYTISGLKPRSRRYPIVCTRGDGKSFKFPASIVQNALKGK